MKFIKKFIPTTLLLIILLISGRYFVFISFIEFEKPILKTEASNNSQTITKQIAANELYANKGGFEWKDNNSEVVINGLYYEVIEIKHSRNGYELLLRSDINESNYFETYFGVEEDEDEKEKNLSLFQLLFQLFLITDGHENFFNGITSLLNYPNLIIDFKMNDHLHRLIKPPSFY